MSYDIMCLQAPSACSTARLNGLFST